MKYRTIRRCNNIKVSEVALGCEGFLGKSAGEFKSLLDRAMELGINFIDMYTSNPDFRDHLGAAIAGRREKLYFRVISAPYGKTVSIFVPETLRKQKRHLKTS